MRWRRRITFIAGMTVVSTAIAAYCCDPWGLPTQQVFIQVGNSVATVIRTSSQTITMRLRGPRSLQSAYEAGVQKALGEVQRQTAEQRVMLQGRIAVDEQRRADTVAGQATQSSQLPPQSETTVTHAVLMGEMQGVVAEKVRAYDVDWSNRFLSTHPTNAVATVMARHQAFCSPGDVKAGACPEAAIPALQNADLTINTLYHPGEGQYDTLSDQEHAAAMAFIQNITQPVPYAPPGKGRTHAGRQLTADLMSDQAVLALVAHSFHVQLAERTRRHE